MNVMRCLLCSNTEQLLVVLQTTPSMAELPRQRSRSSSFRQQCL